MNNYETDPEIDPMIDSDVETEQVSTSFLNSSKKRGRPVDSKTIKKAKKIYGCPKKQIEG
jgi:hypothetical protein